MLCNIPRGLLQMSEGKIKQDSSVKCRSSLLSPVQECERGWKLQWQWQAGCACSFSPKKLLCILVSQLDFSARLDSPFSLCHPLCLPAAMSRRLWSCSDMCWQGGPVGEDRFLDISYEMCPRPWVFPDPPWQIRMGMGLLPLPKLSLSCWIKAAEPGLSLP